MGVRFPRPVQIRLQAVNEATHTVFGVPRRVARKNQAPSSNNEKPPAESNTAPTSPLGSAVRPIMEDVQAIVARTAAANNQRLTVRVEGRRARYPTYPPTHLAGAGPRVQNSNSLRA